MIELEDDTNSAKKLNSVGGQLIERNPKIS